MDYLVYLTLGFIIIYVEITRSRYFLVDHLTFFHFFFFLVYVFAPIGLIFLGKSAIAADLTLGEFYIDKNPLMPFVILISYLFFLSGYYWTAPRNIVSRLHVEYRLSDMSHILLIIFAYMFLILIIAVYLKSNGGLVRTINNAENFRGGFLEANKPYLLKLFSLNALLLYYSYFQVFLKKNKDFRYVFIAFFIVSVGIFFLRAALMNSRGFILLTFLGIYVITVIYNKKYYFKFIAISGFFAILFIKYGDPLFRALPELFNVGFDQFIITFERRIDHINMADGNMISNFMHPIISLGASLSVAGDTEEFRFLKDFYGAVVAIMPNSLTGIAEPRLVQSVITKLLAGMDKPMVLPGILATFSFSFNMVGVFVLMFFYGMYGGFLSEVFKNIYAKHNGTVIIMYALSMSYGYFVFRGSPKNFLLSVFSTILVTVTLLVFTKLIYKKPSF